MASETSVTYFNANAVVDKTAVDVFIPEIWSDEVIAAYKQSLKMAPLVKRMPMVGKKGDTVNIPKPTRGSASAKAEATAITIQASLETDLNISINRHFEYSRLIEDIVDVQALSSLRRFYTDDAGYALAVQVDDDLINCGTGFGDGTLTLAPTDGASWENSNSYYSNAALGATIYTDDTVASGDNFTDLAFRDLIKLMDDNNVPMDNRVCIIPPAARKSIMGLERYVSSDFRNDRTVGTGYIGEVYGVDFYVSSNAPILETSAQNAAAGNVQVRGCLFFHQDAIVLAEQMNVRSQTQYKQEYLADLFTADTIYGASTYRPEAGFILAIADE